MKYIYKEKGNHNKYTKNRVLHFSSLKYYFLKYGPNTTGQSITKSAC